MIAKDRGFILKKIDFRETSLIVTIFTETYGKITGILKGFYSPKKEFTTPMELFTLNEIVFYPKKTQIWLISFADLIETYPFLGKDPEKYFAVGKMFSVVEAVMPLWDKNEKVFRLLQETLRYIDGNEARKMLYIFFIKFLTFCGVKPEFHLCIRCHQPLSRAIFFSPAKGGLVCSRCRREHTDVHSLSPEVIASLRYLQQHDFPQVVRIKPSVSCEERILNLLDTFLAYHLEFKLFDRVYS
ncbi:MAG: DNA repair protein RecO [Candidatus Omnitrophica bacterium]|nr:DNA repair protein RecO [Candidatus Omnitrophota bacterium]